MVSFVCYLLMLAPFYVSAQQADSLKQNAATRISGQVTDAATGQSLPFISIKFTGSKYGTNTDQDGRFDIAVPGQYTHVSFSLLGYQTINKVFKQGQMNKLSVQLHASQTQLKEVSVTSGKKQRYRNKGNPAVELIQQVIDHKAQNRMESSDYLQYDRYERVNLSFLNLPASMMNSRYFKMYQFMLDTVKTDGKTQVLFPAYFAEKTFKDYYRKNPNKTIQVLTARKEVNTLKFIDTAGLATYVNRLYGNTIDLYDNNIFILSNMFLSPIADHSPNYYKFFITDTIKQGNEKLIELSFTPRNKGDLLFEGRLLVSMTGNYAVESCDLNINKQINVNFVRSMKMRLDFKQHPDGKYYLKKSDVKADFGIVKKGGGMIGERAVFYDNYVSNAPLAPAFYNGKELRTEADANKPDTAYWRQHRPDTLTGQQAQVYPKVTQLEQMPQFKRATWLATVLTSGYAKWGTVFVGPIGTLYSYNSQEGSRFQMGGRTTPEFNKNIYFGGFAGYGLRDKQVKYNLSTYFSFNKTQFYRYPNDYIRVNYIYDVGVPGQDLTVIRQQGALSSFRSGATDFWLYNRILAVSYVKDFENKISINFGVKNRNEKPAGNLVYKFNDAAGTVVHDLTTSEINLGFRYAPHEQILQGSVYRHVIHSKYPIFTLQIDQGFKNVLNSAYNYTNITGSIYKRFYLSQLGFADVTLLGGYLAGKVPFPLLSIAPANQAIAFDDDAYNKMTYLEFVSDHYAGLNVSQSFNGFFLNKVPIIKHLKWREYLTGKILFGGLRDENNPLKSGGIYQFPVGANGSNGTYAFGSKPYIEGGVGIGNIFKLMRVDAIKRFNYLDHSGVTPYAIKLSFAPDF